jgi:hypothetical protein
MSGPLPTQFRWLWYLVGLAGMALAVVGLLAMIGSIVHDGLILPVLGIAAVGLGYVLFRYRRRPRGPRRSVDLASSATAPRPESPARAASGATTGQAGATGVAEAADPADAADALQRTSPSIPEPGARKQPSGPPRTSRR